MIAMNYSTLRSHMKYAFDACCDDMETLIVTRKDNRNVVVLSEESYNNLMENLYVRASKKNYDRLLTSIAQAKAGQCKKRDLIEDESSIHGYWRGRLPVLADGGPEDAA